MLFCSSTLETFLTTTYIHLRFFFSFPFSLFSFFIHTKFTDREENLVFLCIRNTGTVHFFAVILFLPIHCVEESKGKNKHREETTCTTF